MGETIHDFILRLRVERAVFHLMFSDRKTITDIALDCGFSSPATFARVFKAFYGVTASHWRKDHRGREADRKI